MARCKFIVLRAREEHTDERDKTSVQKTHSIWDVPVEDAVLQIHLSEVDVRLVFVVELRQPFHPQRRYLWPLLLLLGIPRSLAEPDQACWRCQICAGSLWMELEHIGVRGMEEAGAVVSRTK